MAGDCVKLALRVVLLVSVGLSPIPAHCPPGWLYYKDSGCFLISPDPSTMFESRSACRAAGADLVVIRDRDKHEFLSTRVYCSDCSYWIGLFSPSGDPQLVWVDGSQFAEDEPSFFTDVDEQHYCVVMEQRAGLVWKKEACDALQGYVCEMPNTGYHCPEGWDPWHGSCYLLQTSTPLPWTGALDMCRAYRGADLLYLNSTEEKAWLGSKVSDSFWTGLNDIETESRFFWTAGNSLHPSLAADFHEDRVSGGPRDCVSLDTLTGILTDTDCRLHRPYICKRNESAEWFEEVSGQGLEGAVVDAFVNTEELAQAEERCLGDRQACAAILLQDSRYYLLPPSVRTVHNPSTTVYFRTGCVLRFQSALRATVGRSARCSPSLFSATVSRGSSPPLRKRVESLCRYVTPQLVVCLRAQGAANLICAEEGPDSKRTLQMNLSVTQERANSVRGWRL
nr:PREDICTED: macrophage mannose receptor 1-like isoform X6 [Lepisosteus oculatus]